MGKGDEREVAAVAAEVEKVNMLLLMGRLSGNPSTCVGARSYSDPEKRPREEEEDVRPKGAVSNTSEYEVELGVNMAV